MKIPRSVLVVSSEEDTQNRWVRESEFLHDKEETVGIICASSPKDAEKLLHSNPGICAIVIDVCMQGPNDQNALGLAKKLKETSFSGPVLATSSASFFRDPAVEALCCRYTSKDRMVKELLGVLELHLG